MNAHNVLKICLTLCELRTRYSFDYKSDKVEEKYVTLQII